MKVNTRIAILSYLTFGIQCFLLVAGICLILDWSVKSSVGCGMVAISVSMLIVTWRISNLEAGEA